MLPLVTLMLHVPTLLGASPVHVTTDTLEMEPLVKVRTQLEPYFSPKTILYIPQHVCNSQGLQYLVVCTYLLHRLRSQ